MSMMKLSAAVLPTTQKRKALTGGFSPASAFLFTAETN
jgi:hypothetical protein